MQAWHVFHIRDLILLHIVSIIEAVLFINIQILSYSLPFSTHQFLYSLGRFISDFNVIQIMRFSKKNRYNDIEVKNTVI